MKQDDDKWIKQLHESLQDYSESVPTDGWERLEKELATPPVSWWHRYRALAAAVALLLLLGTSVYIYMLNTSTSDYVKNVTIPQEKIAETISPEPAPVAQDNIIQKNMLANIPVHHHKATRALLIPAIQEVTVKSERTDERTVEATNAKTNLSEENKKNADNAKDDKDAKSIMVPRTHARVTESKSSYSFSNERKRTKTKEGWALGMSLGNNALASNTQDPGFGAFSSPQQTRDLSTVSDFLFAEGDPLVAQSSDASAYKRVLMNNFNTTQATDIKHHQPLTFGLSVRKNLSKRFALESGLTYTYLSSDLKAGQDSYYTQEQKLHYVGIPLKGSWSFVNSKRFTLYLSAGGMVEKCVSSKLETNYVVDDKNTVATNEDIDVDKLQWSVSSAVGAQYNATENLGFFVEPGVVYYFDDGSSVQTIRKDKPLNINLQMGFRITY